MIVGQTLTSLLYAWRLQKKCILLEPFYFHEHSEEYKGYDFSEFSAKNPEELKSNLIFMMSMSSLLNHEGNVASFRFEDQVLITKGNTRIQINNDVELFDFGLTNENIVYDEFHWRVGQAHDGKEIITEDRFCNRIVFHESKRPYVRSSTKDFVVVSKMTNEELLSPDLGQAMTRIKTQRIFKSEGIKGELSFDDGKKKRYKNVKFDFSDRVVIPVLQQKMTFDEVYNLEQIEGEPWKIWKKLISRERTSWV